MNPVLKVSLIAVMMLAAVCINMPVAKAGDVVPILWTSPTSKRLNSVFMVSADDGWAVGESGRIVRWTGTDWIPEFPTSILVSLAIVVTLVAVILTKKVSGMNGKHIFGKRK